MCVKILVVDDDPILLRIIGYAMKSAGHEVVVAKDGREAIRKVMTEDPDLVILDVMLPDLSGFEICQRLRSRPETVNLPIIMLSALSQVANKVEGLEAGADEYVTKPVEIDEIIARVDALLKRTRRLRQASQEKRKKVLGFMGAKGGVGTTTVALNVALALVKREKTVVAVELRPDYGTFAPQLGWTPAVTLTDLLALQPDRIDERELTMRLSTHGSGMRILFGPQRTSDFKTITPDQAKFLVKGLARISDYTVLDLPSCPSSANRAALQQCDLITIVVEPEVTAVLSAKVTLELLGSWGVRGKLAGIVVVNRTAITSPMRLSEIGSQIGCKIIRVVPPAAEACVRAQELGSPVVLSQSNSIMASALTELANRLAADQVFATKVT